MGLQLINALKAQLEKCLIHAQHQAQNMATQVKDERKAQMHNLLGDEFSRLKNLQKSNPAIRDEEIEHLANQISRLDSIMDDAKLELEAVRLIVNNPK